MVNFQSPDLDRTFAALADPTRRALLARLGEAESLSVSELARPFAISLPGVMKHLAVLSDAGLVERRKVGRTVTCRLNAAPMREAIDWLERYQRFWSEGLDRLAAFLEEEKDEACPPPTRDRASPSSGTSQPPGKPSSPPGPTRKS
jgi:DNA-binding transcriptional ArsR family regulator